MNDDYYREIFTKDPYWSSPNPNASEVLRWSLISAYLNKVVPGLSAGLRRPLNLLEVGSGRGWLTNLLNSYGNAMGVEPVGIVVEHAKKLFPKNTYLHGTTQTLIDAGRKSAFDVIVSTEVIEHVPDEEKSAFVQAMYTLLAPGGYVVLTTPRKEVLEYLLQRGFKIDQPVEDWMTEDELRNLYSTHGFLPLELDRIFVEKEELAGRPDAKAESDDIMALYQVWLIQKPVTKSLISVIIPSFNRARLLPRAVASVLSQTFTEFELIIVDDGSTDNTQEWVRSQTDSRIRFLQHPTNLGQNAALNTGVSVAKGDYVAFLDSDDEWLPDFLGELITTFNSDPTLEAVYCRGGARQPDGSVKTSYEFTLSGKVYAETLAQGFLSHMITLMVKRDVFAATGLFDTDFTVCQDDDFCFRVAKHCKVGLVPKVLAVIHSDGGTERVITNDKRNYAEGWLRLFTKYRDEILRNCGCEVMAKHYIKCGNLFLEAGEPMKALDAFSLSAQYLDHCIQENLTPPQQNISHFVPDRESLRRQQIEGLKNCTLIALQSRGSAPQSTQ